MRRTLATAGTVLLVSLALTGCGDDAGGAKAGSKSGAASATPSDLPTGLPTDLSSCLPTEIPSDLPTEIPSDLPTEIPSDLPTEIPSGLASCLPTGLPTDLPTAIPTDVPTDEPTVEPSQASGGALDACAVVTPALITGDLGAASSGQGLSQASSYGDPNAKDCYYFGGDATVVVQATTRADADMPASSTTYEGVPGAEQVPGADRGWVFAASAQGGTTAGVILVKGQHGINCSIITQGRTITVQDLQALAQHALATL